MSATQDRELVDRFYQARGNRGVIEQVMSQDVVWDITPGFPLGGIYRGLSTVLGDFLGPVGAQFASMAAKPEQLIADGEGHVVVIGHYAAVSLDGQQADCRFVHVWTIAGGQLSQLKQTADTRVLQDLLEVSP